MVRLEACARSTYNPNPTTWWWIHQICRDVGVPVSDALTPYSWQKTDHSGYAIQVATAECYS